MTYSQSFLDEHRDINVSHDWWDAVYEDFQHVCEILGIHLKTRSVPLMNGKTRENPCIYFSGFCSQGDGASFEGTYETQSYDFDARKDIFPADTAPERIREYYPKDEELHRIADELCFMRRWYGDVSCKISTSGNYSHSMTMSVDWEFTNEEDQERDTPEIDEIVETTLIDNMRALADWLYARLEEGYAYLTSDEAVAEALEANEIEEDLDEDDTDDTDDEEDLSHAA